MPVSGKEETRGISKQSNSSSAGIPLKKRRFPLFRPPSPTPGKPCSFSGQEEPKDTESTFSGSSCLDASSADNILDKSDTMKKSLLEVKEESQVDTKANLVQTHTVHGGTKFTNVNSGVSSTGLSVSKSLEGSPSICSSSVTSVIHTKPLFEASLVHLHGSTTGIGLMNMKEGLLNQVEDACNLELSTGSGNAELSLGFEKPLIPTLGRKQSDLNEVMSAKAELSLLSLSLGIENPVTRSKSFDSSLNKDGHCVRANRSNWDLNTSMDTWEGSADATAFQDATHCNTLHLPGVRRDIKPSLSFSSVVSAYSDKGKQIIREGQSRSPFVVPSAQTVHQFESADSLHLSLGRASQELEFGQKLFGSTHVNSTTPGPITKAPRASELSINMNSTSCKPVKAEPSDENSKQDIPGSSDEHLHYHDGVSLKRELVKSVSAGVELSDSSPQESVEKISVKSEPLQEGSKETHTAREGTGQFAGMVIQPHESCSSSMSLLFLNSGETCVDRFPTSSELSGGENVSNQCQHANYNKEAHSRRDVLDQTNDDILSNPVNLGENETNLPVGEIDTCRLEDLKNNAEMFQTEEVNERPYSHVNGEGSVSEDEKINISMLDEEPYGSDYESDGNHAFAGNVDMEDRQHNKEDEYEDGEVREPLVESALEKPFDDPEAENKKIVDSDSTNAHPFGFTGNDNTFLSHLEENDSELQTADRTNEHIKECVASGLNEKAQQLAGKDSSEQKSLSDRVIATDAKDERSVSSTHVNLPDQSEKKDDQEIHEKDILCDEANSGSHGTVITSGDGSDEHVKGSTSEMLDLSVPAVDAPINVNDVAAKDPNCSGNKSRIISLPRSSNTASPSRTRSIPDRPLSLRGGRERYSSLEGERSHPRRNRDDIYGDGPNKFERERVQNRSFGNTRHGFMRGRGRTSGRLNNFCEWNSGRNYASEDYNETADYRFTRRKHASAMADAELGCDDYVMSPDGSALGASRGRGRKTFNDETPPFRHPSSRRLSPGAREGHVVRGGQVPRRIARNVSPSRCSDEDDSELVGIRHGPRNLQSDDITEPLYTRRQNMYDGSDGQFRRGNRNFSTTFRRDFPRIRSKSPPESRSHSPGSWSSPRRRSPDGFNGPLEVTRHRSPAMYRMNRMRSPGHAGFPEEMVPRRRGSPPYMSRSSNADSVRDGLPRSSRRSSSEWVFSRNHRRLDVIDPRERDDGDEFLDEAMHSRRFHNFRGGGNSDARRIYGDRRGMVRSFRPPYNRDNDNGRFHLDDGPRPFRFCPDSDTKFVERNNARERDDARGRRPVFTPRRMRNIDEQEGNYRQEGNAWNDDGFKMKRRRF